jgi:hypothetical protein
MSDLDKAFQVLEMYGVPKSRARTVANGIQVLMDRLHRAELSADIVPCSNWVEGNGCSIGFGDKCSARRCMLTRNQDTILKRMQDDACPFCVGRTGMVSATCEECFGSGKRLQTEIKDNAISATNE